jgi:hypothetical protein
LYKLDRRIPLGFGSLGTLRRKFTLIFEQPYLLEEAFDSLIRNASNEESNRKRHEIESERDALFASGDLSDLDLERTANEHNKDLNADLCNG